MLYSGFLVAFRTSVFVALLVLACSLTNGEARRRPKQPASKPFVIKSSLTYEFGTYSCKAQIATALLTVLASKKSVSRAVLSVTSVMDISGSMEWDGKLELMQQTNDFLLKQLAGLDKPHKFGTVTFSNSAAELTPLEVIQPSSLKAISDKIKGTKAVGGTNLLDAVKKGFEQQSEDADAAKYVRVVFLFTDGVQDPPLSRPDEITEKVKELVQQRPDITFYTFGYGKRADYNQLRDISEAGSGTVSMIDSPEAMVKAFGAASEGLLTQLANKIVYKFTPKNGAKIVEVKSAGKIKQHGGSYEVDLGDIQQGEQRSIIIRHTMTMTCTACDPIDIDGTYYISGTNEDATDNPTRKKCGRKQKPDQQSPNENVGAEILRRGEFNDRFTVARKTLREGDKASALAALKALARNAEATAMAKKKKWVKDGLDDVMDLIERIENKSNTNDEYDKILVDLDAVRDAIVKQRTGSTDENLRSVQNIMTPAKRAMIIKAEVEVLGKRPPVPFALSTSYAVSHQTTASGYKVVDVKYVLKAPPVEEERPSLSLTIVVDTSQSMDDDATKTIVQTLKRLVDWLRSRRDAEISLGVITFADTTETLLDLKSISAIDVPGIKSSFDAIQAGGTAKISAALAEGIDQQLEAVSCAGAHAVFVLSNSAVSSSSDVLNAFKARITLAKFPIYVYTFAMKQSDAGFMGKIADSGNGLRYILSSHTDIPSSFGDAIGGLLGISAKNVKITFEPGDSTVEISSIFPGELQGKGVAHAFSAYTFQKEEREFLVSVRFPDADAPRTLLKISTSYEDAFTCGSANSNVTMVGPDEEEPDSLKQRKLDKAVTEELKQAAGKCMTASDMKDVINNVDAAISLIPERKKTRQDGHLESDLSIIVYSLLSASEDDTQGWCCAQLEALVDLLESERSKGTLFLLSKDYDSKAQKEGREALAPETLPPIVCQGRNPTAQRLRARVSAWTRLPDMAGLPRSCVRAAKSQRETHVPREIEAEVVRDIMETRKRVMEAVVACLTRVDAALARNDVVAAMNEVLAALDRAQGSPHRDDSIIYASICHLVQRGVMLLRSVNAGCPSRYEPYEIILPKRSEVEFDAMTSKDELKSRGQRYCPFCGAGLGAQ